MNCLQTQRLLPGYLDGAIEAGDHARVRAHLAWCAECREQLEQYRVMAVCLANVETAAAPAGLALRIRVEASRVRSPWGWATRARQRAVLLFDNIVRPLAVPAAGGVLAALGIFVLLVQSILVGIPVGGAVANDSPLNLVQPAELESLAPFPISGITTGDGGSATAGDPNSGALVLEATLNAQGQVVRYKILSGPKGAAIERQIDQVLWFSRFRPELNFGSPTDGGRVLLNFSEVRVRG